MENRFKVGDILDSNTCGQFEIINSYIVEGVSNKNAHQYDVRFLSNGNIVKGIKQANILRKRVYNPTHGFVPNRLFQSNTSGPFLMLEHLGHFNSYSRVKIKFTDTGYVADVDLKNALEGRVKDPTLTSMSHNFDRGRIDNYPLYIISRLKSTYFNMMDRCYNPNSQRYKNYGGIGITVCEQWKNDIHCFLSDVIDLFDFASYYEFPYLYHLDKDWISFRNGIPREQRIYSPETCVWLYYLDNINLARIENKLEGKYFGIANFAKDKYVITITIDRQTINLGTFTNLIAAINVYNFYYMMVYHPFKFIPLINQINCAPMSLQEAMSYKIN